MRKKNNKKPITAKDMEELQKALSCTRLPGVKYEAIQWDDIMKKVTYDPSKIVHFTKQKPKRFKKFIDDWKIEAFALYGGDLISEFTNKELKLMIKEWLKVVKALNYNITLAKERLKSK